MNRSILVVLCFLTVPAAAATKTWTGAVDNLWSTGGNWSGGVAPADGDSLAFPVFGPNRTNVNDLAGLDLQSVSFDGGDALPAYNVSGNAITLSGGITDLGGVVIWSIPTTLTASQTFEDNYETELAGTIDLNGHTLTLDAGVSRLSGSLIGTGAFDLSHGHLNLSGSATFTGPLAAATGARINVTGTISGPTVTFGTNAVLAGTGTVPAVVLNGAFLRPGNAGNGNGVDAATGILTAGDVTMTGGSFDAAIKGTTPGSGHDQLSVSGVVTLNNSQLVVTLPVGSPMPGHAYVIVQNDGADAISGTFSGLPQGAIIPVGSASFQITYTGGDGNDIALITQNAGPKSWTGAVDTLWSTGGNWSGGVAPADGDSLVFPGFVPNRTNTNDLAGLDLQSLSFGGGEGFPYFISGNAITLSGGITSEGTVAWSIPTTLAASQTFDDDYELTFAGPVDLNGHTLTLVANVTRLSGSLIGTGAFNLHQYHLNLSGSSTFTGPLAVAAGARINVTGTISGSTLTAGTNAILAGTGTVPAVVLNGAFLRPGNAGNGGGLGPATGILTSGDLTMTGGSFDAAIKNTTPGSGYDRLSVSGAVTLNNPQLLVLLPASAPAIGSAYIILDNDGNDAVIGTFSGLPEGAAFFASPSWFRITYAGGTGNDVVLTAIGSTNTTIASSPNPSIAGRQVTLTAAVSAGSGTPAGTVRFVEGNTTLATATLNASGIATATIVLPTGDHSIVAEYAGGGAFAPSSSAPLTHAVNATEDVPALDGIGLLMLTLATAVAGVIVMKRL